MPNCGRVARIHSSRLAGGWHLAISVQPSIMREHFALLIRNMLPSEIEVESGSEPHSILLSSDRISHYESTRAFMDLLRDSVTIGDDADGSYALGLHWFADIQERSQLGDLVEQAKDYGRDNPSDPQALELLLRSTLDWLTMHPLIESLNAVASIPGTQPKEVDLPAALAEAISRRFGKRRLLLRSRNRTPQKGRADSKASSARSLSALMNADRDAFGKRVLLIDDLYRSGNTMMAGVKALRRAGATAVYCVALTKTARHCNGLPAGVDNWPDKIHESLQVDDTDLPFC